MDTIRAVVRRRVSCRWNAALLTGGGGFFFLGGRATNDEEGRSIVRRLTEDGATAGLRNYSTSLPSA